MNNFVKKNDAWTTKYFVDPLAIPVSKIIAKTFVSPNMLTTLSIFIAFFSAYLFFNDDLILGAIIFYCSFFIDCLDGKVARLKNTSSDFGQKYDQFSDMFNKFLIFISLVYSQFVLEGQVFLGVLLFFLYYLNHLVHKFLLKKTGGYQNRKLSSFSKWLVDKGIFPSLYSYLDEQFLIFILFLLFFDFKLSLIIGMFLFFILKILAEIKHLLLGGTTW